MPTDDPDLELIAATGQGDHEAFESLVKRYQRPLLNFVTRFSDRYMAEDITQEVFLRIYRAAPRFQSKAKVSTWIFQIAYNQALTEIGRRKRWRNLNETWHQNKEDIRRRVARFAFAVQVEEVAADGGRRLVAITHQIVPILIAQFGRVALEGGHEIDTVLRRNAGLDQARAQPVCLLETGDVANSSRDRLLEPVEPGHLLVGRKTRIVGDVVDGAGEAVKQGHVRAQLRRDQYRADREILVVRALAGRGLDQGGLCQVVLRQPADSSAGP